MKISVVIPVYGCPEALKPLHDRLVNTLNKITKSYEIILVNDGCPKNSWKQVKQICKIDKKVIGINLSRNFGQTHATNAGINESKGDYTIVMDCDLQDKPEAIIDMYKKIQEGYDIVFVKRKDRKDSKITKFMSSVFYKIYNCFVDGYYDSEIGNYCIVKKKIIEEYKKIKDNNKSFTSVLCWMGYKTATIDVEGDERFEGKSSYTFKKKVNLAIDMLTSQSNAPLKFLIKFGVIIAALGFLYLFIQIIIYFVTRSINEGWTSIIASILVMGGLILISIGGVGIYVGNIFNQTKGIPEYFISEIINKNEK